MTPLERGVALHNQGRYFEAHEAWEELWRAERDPLSRRLLQGLIQVTAAFHKGCVMGDRESAERLLARGLTKLDGVPNGSFGLELDRFRAEVRSWARTAEAVPKLNFRVGGSP